MHFVILQSELSQHIEETSCFSVAPVGTTPQALLSDIPSVVSLWKHERCKMFKDEFKSLEIELPQEQLYILLDNGIFCNFPHFEHFVKAGVLV